MSRMFELDPDSPDELRDYVVVGMAGPPLLREGRVTLSSYDADRNENTNLYLRPSLAREVAAELLKVADRLEAGK